MKRFSQLLWASLLTSTLLAACSGGIGGGSASTPLSPLAPSAESSSKLPVRMTVKIPRRHRGRKPAYLSPATQSMTIRVTSGTKTVLNETIDLTDTSSGCQASLASTLCTLKFFIGAGKYAASITTFDQLNGAGNALSTAQGIAFKVVAGKANSIALTLSGIPAKIAIFPAGTYSVYALAQDADGNFIVGAGSPAFTAANVSGPAVAAISQPASSAPNTIGFSAAVPAVTGVETIGVTASYPAGATNACTQPGAVCTASTTITASNGPQMFVANYSANISAYTLPLSSPTQAPDATYDVAVPYPIVADANGNIFGTSYQTAGALFEISPPYTSLTNLNSGVVDNPYGIAIAANGDAFIANTGNSSITLLTSPYSGPATSITSGVSTPYGVVMDSSNNLYVANEASKKVTVYGSPYTGTPTATFSTTDTPYSIAIDNGKLFVGETGAIDVFALPVTSASTPAATLSKNIDDVYGLAFDGSGNLYNTNYFGGTNGVGSITEFTTPFSTGNAPAATVSESATGNASYYPWTLGFDAAGNLYVSNTLGGANSGGVAQYSLPLSNSSVPAIALNTPAMDYPYFIAFGKSAFFVSP